jgi:hypothetical protein
MAQQIGPTFSNSVKKNLLFISDGSGVINIFIKSCNPRFFAKKDNLGQKRLIPSDYQ